MTTPHLIQRVLSTRHARTFGRAFLVAGIAVATASCAIEALDEAEIQQLEEELRIGGVTPASPTTPWTAEPTVIHKVSLANTGTTFNTRQSEFAALGGGYYPSLLASAQRSGVAARFVGAWHKDSKVSQWIWDRDIADANFATRFNERRDAGYEFFDYNVHVDGSTPRYDTVWIKRASQRGWAAYRNQSLASLTDRVATLKADGYRLKRLNEYKVGSDTRYVGLWVADGLTDFKWTTSKTSSQILSLNDTYVAQGYRITDLSPHNNGSAVVYSAVWLKNSEIREYSYDSNMTTNEFHTRHAQEVNRGRVLVDINLFYDTANSLRYSAIWHRNTRNNTLESNVSLSGSTTLSNTIASYSGSSDSRVGLFVQNLTSGTWVAYNLHEPFYMASTVKTLIGAKVLDDERATWDPLALRAGDWRADERRGWLLAHFNGTTYPLDDFLGNMLNFSDTASTDRLWGIVEADSAGSLQRYIDGNLGVHNIGEATSICELDRRIVSEQSDCVWDVSCDTFEAWYRGGDSSYRASAAEQTCLGSISRGTATAEGHRRYYSTLANFITPAEFGRALADISAGEMAATERARLFDIMDATDDNGFSPDRRALSGSDLYDAIITKGGNKAWMESQVGVMFDWGPSGGYSDIDPVYTFAVFVKNDTTRGGVLTSNQVAWMRSAVRDAVRFVSTR